MNTEKIKRIEKALRFHCNYENNFGHGGKYLKLMDDETWN